MSLFKRAIKPEPTDADISEASPADALDALDTDRIDRARVLLAADRSLTQREIQQAQADLEAAGRGTMEFDVLKSAYTRIDAAGDVRLKAAIQKQHGDAQDRILAIKAQRPVMWRALTPLARAAYIVASESSQPIGDAIMKLVRLVDADTTASEIPSTFEPRRI